MSESPGNPLLRDMNISSKILSSVAEPNPEDVEFPFTTPDGRGEYDDGTGCQIWVVVNIDPDEPTWLTAELDCEGPPYNHCLRCELEALSLTERYCLVSINPSM